MKLKKFRMSCATIDYIVADFTLNRITDRDNCFMGCVSERLERLNASYNRQINRVLNSIILYCSYDSFPVEIISKIIYSLSKVTNALSRGILSIIKE